MFALHAFLHGLGPGSVLGVAFAGAIFAGLSPFLIVPVALVRLAMSLVPDRLSLAPVRQAAGLAAAALVAWMAISAARSDFFFSYLPSESSRFGPP